MHVYSLTPATERRSLPNLRSQISLQTIKQCLEKYTFKNCLRRITRYENIFLQKNIFFVVKISIEFKMIFITRHPANLVTCLVIKFTLTAEF